MEVNPYESPRTGEPFEEKPMVDSDAVRQLLTEIRDTQRELLEMQREALVRQRKSYWFMIVPFVFMALPLYAMYRTMSRPRPTFPAPMKAPSRVGPQATPSPASATP